MRAERAWPLPRLGADHHRELGGERRWTVPIGGGVGKIFHFGRLLVNMQLGAYWNVIAPDIGPDWQLRFQIQFMFPK